MRLQSAAGRGSAGSRHALHWIGAEVPAGRYFEGDRVLLRIAPFLAAGALPFLLLPFLGVSVADWRVGLAFAISLGIVGTALLLPWDRFPRWTQTLPVLAEFAVIALLRDASGEDAVILEPLVIVPLTWFALYGTRMQLFAGIATMVAVMALPPLLIGPPVYDGDQIVRAGIVAVIAGTTGVAVQALVMATRSLASEGRAILEASQDAFVAVDEKGVVTELNPQAEATFGWTRSELLGRSAFDTVIPPERREFALERLRRFREEGERPPDSRFEARGRRRDGSVFPIEMSVSPVQTGERWTLNAFVHDISARTQARSALQEAEERFRRAFEDNRVGMALLSAEGEFTRVNAAFCDLLAYSPDELLGTPFPEITHPDDIEASIEGMHEIVAGERFGYRAEKRCLHSKGHHLWTAVNVSPIRDERGELIHLIAQIEDITERKEQEERLTHQALHDPLTGLPNRVLFADRVRVASARRESGSFGVIYIDLDTFKPINDTFGHSAGDEVLVEVARRLESRLREGDTLARLGGDEFAVLCEDSDEVGGAAGRRARDRRVREAVRDRRPRGPPGRQHRGRPAAARRPHAWTPSRSCAGPTLPCTAPRRRATPATRCSRAGWATTIPTGAGWRGSCGGGSPTAS